MDLTDVHTVFHLTTAQYTFFSAAHGTVFKIDRILRHKASLSKYKKVEKKKKTLHSIWSQCNKTGTQQQTTKTTAENTQIIGG
jgi:hypothetical protein